MESITGFPEMLDGRVKTLHPTVHGGLLARRDNPVHLRAMEEHGITPIDLVAVNLYPFRATIAQPDVSFEDAIENIDIGGPSMLRSAAKNHEFVLPVVDPSDYAEVLAAPPRRRHPARRPPGLRGQGLRPHGRLRRRHRRVPDPGEDGLPARLGGSLERMASLRYGENPNQRAALYVTEEPRGIRDLKQRQGKELSFNNLLDLDGAMAAVAPWTNRPACAVIKHTTPCGIAVGLLGTRGVRARAWRPTRRRPSAAWSPSTPSWTGPPPRRWTGPLRRGDRGAPAFHDDALKVLAAKKNLRVVELPVADGEPGARLEAGPRRIPGAGPLPLRSLPRTAWTVPTVRQPDRRRNWRTSASRWAAVAAVKSNAILLARGRGGHRHRRGPDEPGRRLVPGRAQGAAAGTRPARRRARLATASSRSPTASRQRPPPGSRPIIQPGGSVSDAEVIAAADRLGLAMVLTGRGMFRH